MKNVYLVLGGAVIAVVAFTAGSYYDRFQGAVSTVEGEVVSRDNSSITVRTADNSVRSISLLDSASVLAQPEALLSDSSAITVGQRVTVTLSGDTAANVVIHISSRPPSAQ